MSSQSLPRFDELGLTAPVLEAISAMGFDKPTPIQAQAIPVLLQGGDLIGQAQTGTGKTAAFGLPALAHIDVAVKQTQMLVIAPTRELAIQVAEALESYGKQMRGLQTVCIYGGQAYGPQLAALSRGPQIVVGTPGRLMDHLRKGKLKLDAVKVCVLDEADEMLNMGFLEDIEWILEHLPDSTQMALFSATMPPAIKRVAERFLTQPEHIRIKVEKRETSRIQQKAWTVRGMTKMMALERMIESLEYDGMIVFVRTRGDTLELADRLSGLGYKAAALNGDMNQSQRERTVDQLKSGAVDILIATDVVARGLDVPRISHVINYDLPMDAESYVHRIGRTGRAGRQGEAILFARPRENYLLRQYERLTNGTIEQIEMPTAEQLGEQRVNKMREALVQEVEALQLDQMRELVVQMAEQSDLSALDLAAALLHHRQLSQPLFPSPDPKPRQRAERGERGERGEKAARGERRQRDGIEGPRKRSRPDANVDWQAYRLEVGREHGTRPGDIVGAIANEADIDSQFIGEIRLFDTHSFVNLPAGMPSEVFQHLKKVRIRNKQLDLTPAESLPPRADRGQDGFDRPAKGRNFRKQGAAAPRGQGRGRQERRYS